MQSRYLFYLSSVCLTILFVITYLFLYPNINNLLPSKIDNKKSFNNVQPSLLQNYSKLPLSFEVNFGQTDSQVKFFSRGKGYNLLLTEKETLLTLKNDKQKIPTTVKMQFVGSNPKPKLEAIGERAGKINYFIGNDKKNWHTNLSEYNKVKYESIYPGIDAIYYGNQQQLEYDLVVSPSASPKEITIQLDVDSPNTALSIDTDGNLIIPTSSGNLYKHKPIIYQEIDGTKEFIAGSYQLKGNNIFGFEVADYDLTKPLVIDPVFIYSTYFGGTDRDRGFGITVDKDNNVYLTGETLSISFPLKNPFQNKGGGTSIDIFITKLNSTATEILYSTYVVGNDIDSGFAIAVDPQGNAYVTGETYSTNLPVVNAVQSTGGGGVNIDAFVVKLNPTGNELLYSTYLGGTLVERAFSIKLNAAGNVYIAGETTSLDLPVKNAFQTQKSASFDAFVARLSVDGSSLDFCTYLGGNDLDKCHDMTLDSDSNVYMVGETVSSNFPTKNAGQAEGGGINNIDIFITKLNPTGSIIFSTYLGPLDLDRAFGIAVDSQKNIYITGMTNSVNFPTVNPAQTTKGGAIDAYVMKLDPTAKTILYCTYIGGSKDEVGFSVAVDQNNNIYVYGETMSLTDFPMQRPLQNSSTGGFFDAFLAKYDSNGALVFSTYLGGNNPDRAGQMVIDSLGDVYLIGHTPSLDFPVANALQPDKGGDDDIFLVKVSDPAITCPQVSFLPSSLTDALVNTFYNQTISIANNTTTYTFSITSGKLPTGLTFNTNGLLFGTPTETGTFNLVITAIDPNGCVSNQLFNLVVRQVSGDFTLNVNPTLQSIVAGSSTSFNVEVLASSNFSQPITIAATSNNSTISISPVSVTINPGNRITFTVNTSNNTPLSQYPITFTGTVGSLVRSQMAILEVTSNAPDFTLSLTPSTTTLMAGASADFTARVLPIRGFAEPVMLQTSISPSTNDLTISPQTAVASPNSNTTFNLKASNIASGNFTLTITATSGQIVRTATTNFNVLLPDFQISFNPSQINITRGQSGQFNVNITRSGGFTGNVTVNPDATLLKALKIKVMQPSQTTSAASVSFNFKVKNKAPLGRQQLSFTGRDELGNVRTGILTLVIQ